LYFPRFRELKNTAVGGGEHSPEISDEATVEVKLAP
jgi:hypothetical protein